MKHITGMSSLILASILALSIAGCTASRDLFGTPGVSNIGKTDVSAAIADFPGCINGTALDYTRIKVEFQLPDGAEKISIYRNGGTNPIYFSTNKNDVPFVDTGLVQGQSYTYTCEASFNGVAKQGTNVLRVATASFEAPVFGGIQSVQLAGPSSITVKWQAEDRNGIAAEYFQVYAKLGTAVNWGAASAAIAAGPVTSNGFWVKVPTGTFSLTFENLGEELPYAFAVRACSAQDKCDSNNRSCNAANGCSDSNAAPYGIIPDSGNPPATAGATEVNTAANRSLVLTVPWQERLGGVTKRHIYQRIADSLSQDISLYTEILAPPVTDITNPSQNINIGAVLENTHYWFIVRDEDPAGRISQNTNVIEILTPDLTPPLFGGATYALGVDKETEVVVTFAPIARQGTADPGALDGTTDYRIYIQSVPYDTYLSNSVPPSNACAGVTKTTVPYAKISDLTGATEQGPFPPGAARTYKLAGLIPRTYYSICMKAFDAAGNQSLNDDAGLIATIDTHAPSYGGMAGDPIYDSVNSDIKVSFNKSDNWDLDGYVLKLWKAANLASCKTDPGLTNNIYFAKATVSPNGAGIVNVGIGGNAFTYYDGDTVCALVDVCDNAQILPGGAQNCTSTDYANAVGLTLPSTVPPPGFRGIETVTSTVQGQATVQWYWGPAGDVPPAKFAGFYVYLYKFVASPGKTSPTQDPNDYTDAVLASECAGGACAYSKKISCAAGGCTLSDKTVTLSGLDPGKYYKWVVKGFDASGNVTNYIDVNANMIIRPVADTTPPSFGGNAQLDGVTQTYSFATGFDNQPAEDLFTYEVYRSIDLDFDAGSNPPRSLVAMKVYSTRINTSGTIAYTDPTTWNMGSTYYFIGCMVDDAGNRSCDPTSKSYLVPDPVPPVITGLMSNKTRFSRKWSLGWNMSDNHDSAGNLKVWLYQTYTAASPEIPTADETCSTPGLCVIAGQFGISNISTLTTTQNANGWMNYLLVVKDLAGNIAKDAISVPLEGNVLSITAIRRPQGPTAGGQNVIVTGTGFTRGSENGYGAGTGDTQVYFGAYSASYKCTSVQIIDERHLSCITPVAPVNGPVTVYVANPDEQVALLNNAYTFEVASSHPCDAAPSHAFFQAGAGTLANPFLLCTLAQINNLRNASYLTKGYYYKLADIVDFDASPLADQTAFVPIGNSTTAFVGGLDGDYYALKNFKYSNATTDYIGVFGKLSASSGVGTAIKNIGVLNVDFNGRYYVGGLAGDISGPAASTVQGIYATGKLQADYRVGGIAGSVSISSFADNSFTSTSGGITFRIAAGPVGGLIGTTNGTFPISNSFARTDITGSVSGNGGSLSGLGGIVGDAYNATNIQNCYATGTLGDSRGRMWIGGIAGKLDAGGTIASSRFYGTINTLFAWSYAGGILGSASGGTTDLNNNFADVVGNFTGYVTGGAGGIVGYLYGGTLLKNRANVYFTVGDNNSGNNSPAIGGLLGTAVNASTIDQSYATGSMSGISYLTGIAGAFVGTIRDSYSKIALTSNVRPSLSAYDVPFGITRQKTANSSAVTIENSFFAGAISTTASSYGISPLGTNLTTTGSFWDKDVSGLTSAGAGEGKTTVVMKPHASPSLFETSGWDFTLNPVGASSVWRGSFNEGDFSSGAGGYPVLSWQGEWSNQ